MVEFQGTLHYQGVKVKAPAAMERAALNVDEIAASLIARGIKQADADAILIRAMYIDDAIGAGKMTGLIDELVKNPKFKNPENLLENLNKCFNGNSIKSKELLEVMNEYNTGKYWLDKGEEVYISKKWLGGQDNEVDVTVVSNKTLIECKNVSAANYKTVGERIQDIINKFTLDGKLSSSIRNQYPNHYGQLRFSEASNPLYNSSKADFIKKIMNGIEGESSFIGNGANQIPFEQLKKVEVFYIENNTGSFIITSKEWK